MNAEDSCVYDREAPLTRMTARQAQIHVMIQRVGGYWRPINAVARVLEELAELGEQLELPSAEDTLGRISDEFADLWIISTCLGNQFNVILDSKKYARRNSDEKPVSFDRLVRDAGQIARVVNYYDGPKNPRTMVGFPTLGDAISTFQATLGTLASHHGVDLDAAVETKTAGVQIRDRDRFSVSYDPSTADSLHEFQIVRQSTPCLFSKVARLWGGPEWRGDLAIEHNVDLTIPFLACFAKAARPESLDGFVLRLPDGPDTCDMSALARYFARILTSLAARDPRPNDSFAQSVMQPGWQFSFHDTRLFVSVFSPLYMASHSRHSQRGTFVMFQPETSFDAHQVGSKFPCSSKIKERIRRDFIRSGVTYPSDQIEEKLEPRIYVLPRWKGDPEVAWWQYL